MRIIGMINHYLVSAMMTAALIWVICLGVNLIRKKLVNVKVWIIRYVMITYLVSVFMITDAYKAFVEGIPDFFISPNFIPVYNFIMDVGSNPVETLMQAIYNIVLLIPFGVLLPPSLPEYSIRLKKVLVITVAFVVIVEVMEYLSGRYMDIDDIILNTFGSMIGYFIYCFFVSGKEEIKLRL
ncbi:MAG: VanZ family protein [Lachnospiraceae bacterium]|nr:VanZ family protein [Lachnospiraceae bacterium]